MQVGQMLTGRDRSYPRSLYQVASIGPDDLLPEAEELVGMKIICLGGTFFKTEELMKLSRSEVEEIYRQATDEEIACYMRTGKCEGT